MVIIYQNCKGDPWRIKNVIHIQNIEGGKFEILTNDGIISTLSIDRLEAIADEQFFSDIDKTKEGKLDGIY